MNAKDAIYSKTKEIVESKGYDVCYKDFISFELDGKKYFFKKGTIRNAFSSLSKEGKIELQCRSPIAFYTLEGMKYEKEMTLRYRGVQNKIIDFYIKLFKIHGLNDPAIHDIRLLFNLPDLRSILTTINSDLIYHIDNKSNKDIKLKNIVLDDDTIIKTTIHNTGNVSVMISCSENPIPFDSLGLSKLSSGLTRVEERLQREIDGYYNERLNDGKGYDQEHYKCFVPNHMSWIVTMWHFGKDSTPGFSGNTFDITWKEVHELYHIYSKKRKSKTAQ